MRNILTFCLLLNGFVTGSVFAQSSQNNPDEITVYKKANPNYKKKKETIVSENDVTDKKAQNPNSKKETEDNYDVIPVTDKKTKNPK